MKKTFYLFHINPSMPLDLAWEELSLKGVEIAYGSEEDDSKQLFGYWDNSKPLPKIPFVTQFEKTELPTIDWENQWAEHGLNYSDGFVHVDLSEFGGPKKELKLKAGPGFGDLSHPTTKLVLQLMTKKIKQSSVVVDIGCGSGILSIASVALGAMEVIGIDIDPEAIEHSVANTILNEMESKCTFTLPQNFKYHVKKIPLLIVMNMISSEQMQAWDSISALHQIPATIITSGIRIEEKEQYIALTASWGWKCRDVFEQEDWLGFVFKKNRVF